MDTNDLFALTLLLTGVIDIAVARFMGPRLQPGVRRLLIPAGVVMIILASLFASRTLRV